MDITEKPSIDPKTLEVGQLFTLETFLTDWQLQCALNREQEIKNMSDTLVAQLFYKLGYRLHLNQWFDHEKQIELVQVSIEKLN